jgi:hypothetical protein
MNESRRIAMNKIDREPEAPTSSFQRERRDRLLVAIALAALGAGAIYAGFGSHFAAAAPQPVPPSLAGAATTQDSQQWHIADADADVGPGVCEPCVANSP